MVEKNYVSKLELELFLIVVVTAAGRRTGRAHVEAIIQQMTPDSIIHRLGHVSQHAAARADLLRVLAEACVGVYFLLLFQSATAADSVPTVSKMMMSEKVIK